MTALDEISTLEDAAAFLKIEPAKLRRLVNQKRIGYLKQGHALTFPRGAIEAYIEANITLPTPQNPHGLTSASLSKIRGRAA